SGARALLLVSRAVGVDRQPAALGFGSGNRLRWSSRAFALRGGRNDRGLTIDDGLRPGLVVVGADDGANVKLALLAGRDDVALARGDDALGLGRRKRLRVLATEAAKPTAPAHRPSADPGG